MKKSLFPLFVIASLSLSACTTTTPTSIGETLRLSGAAMLISPKTGGGIVDIAVGSSTLKNAAMTVTAENIKLVSAPEGAQCGYVNAPPQLYCRLGDLPAYSRFVIEYTGNATAGKFGYTDSKGEVQIVQASFIGK